MVARHEKASSKQRRPGASVAQQQATCTTWALQVVVPEAVSSTHQLKTQMSESAFQKPRSFCIGAGGQSAAQLPPLTRHCRMQLPCNHNITTIVMSAQHNRQAEQGRLTLGTKSMSTLFMRANVELLTPAVAPPRHVSSI